MPHRRWGRFNESAFGAHEGSPRQTVRAMNVLALLPAQLPLPDLFSKRHRRAVGLGALLRAVSTYSFVFPPRPGAGLTEGSLLPLSSGWPLGCT